jgi:uncharacterized YigZ family protein
MFYIDSKTTVTYEIKKSKFIATLIPSSSFESTMEQLKIQHPKGRHFVYAYRYLNSFDQVVENSSDDGEPKGTSGKPTLAVLSGNELINSAVIIVRYFGGIKLGTGGLVKAYSEATNLAIAQADLKKYIKLNCVKIQFDYPHVSKVEYQANYFEIEIVDKIFEQKVSFVLSGGEKPIEQLLTFLKQENIIDQNDIIPQ